MGAAHRRGRAAEWLADDVEFEPEAGAPLARWDARGARRASSRSSRPSEWLRFRWRDGAGRLAGRVAARRRARRHALRHRAARGGGACTTRSGRRRLSALRPRRDAVPGVETSARSSPRWPTPRGGGRALARRRAGAHRLASGRRAADDASGGRQASRALVRAGLVQARREGRETRYTLTPAPLGEAIALDGVGRRALGRAAGAAGSAGERLRREDGGEHHEAGAGDRIGDPDRPPADRTADERRAGRQQASPSRGCRRRRRPRGAARRARASGGARRGEHRRPRDERRRIGGRGGERDHERAAR